METIVFILIRVVYFCFGFLFCYWVIKNESTWIDGLRHFDFERMDTRRAEKYTDERLLQLISGLKLFPGYGLVAEVCKRFSKLEKGNK